MSEIWDLIFLELYPMGFSLLCLGNCSSFETQLRCSVLCGPAALSYTLVNLTL